MSEKKQKKAFVLRMDPERFKLLERWAADEFRSLNGQIEYLLHRALHDGGRLNKRNASAHPDETLDAGNDETDDKGGDGSGDDPGASAGD